MKFDRSVNRFSRDFFMSLLSAGAPREEEIGIEWQTADESNFLISKQSSSIK
jgi:hypothetical protein